MGESLYWGEEPDTHTWSLGTACGNGICFLLHASSTQPQLQEATGDMTWVCPQSQAGWLFSSSKPFLLRMSNAEGASNEQKLFPHHLPLSAAPQPLIQTLSLLSVIWSLDVSACLCEKSAQHRHPHHACHIPVTPSEQLCP